MNIQKLRRQVIKSRRDGFSDKEIRMAMSQDGVPDETIRQVFHSLNSQNQKSQQRAQKRGSSNPARKKQKQRQPTRPEQKRKRKQKQNRQQANNRQIKQDDVRKLSNNNSQRQSSGSSFLTGDKYKLKQKLLSLTNSYHVYEGDEMILKARAKMFRLHEDIKFKTPDGEEVFEVKAEQITDVAGDYTLLKNGEPLTTLEKKFSIAEHRWKIKANDETERLLAKVESKSPVIAWLRVIGGYMPLLPNFFALIPHVYEIKTGDDRIIGKIEGKFSIRDTYEIEINDTNGASRDAILASAISIDALEGN